ncbi:hypothetical protein PanWU01x14_041590 [Parasponia andersonii]|uniref:Uncharacterized protein n=1 Tax=Parasponia andersonii TaxID=3476 RepID=A0A2P5DQG0_PARAD|nr:hypothetical protein PanWU01x14_041590 [Parasponia andersonii]
MMNTQGFLFVKANCTEKIAQNLWKRSHITITEKIGKEICICRASHLSSLTCFSSLALPFFPDQTNQESQGEALLFYISNQFIISVSILGTSVKDQKPRTMRFLPDDS